MRAWGKRRGYSEKLAGALSKFLHDQDGHVSSLHSVGEAGREQTDGLRVTNAAGISRFTFCNGQLFLPPGAAQLPAVATPVRAFAESVKELLLAWREGADPAGTFAATPHVPFRHPEARTLIEKLSSAMPPARFDRLRESVNWYLKISWVGQGLEAEHVRALLDGLPNLMDEFRRRVAADVAADPTIARRVAAGYLTGFRRVA